MIACLRLRLPGFLFVIAVICFVRTASGQDADRRISVNFKNTSLKTVLNSITAKTGFDFFYSNQQINDQSRVTVNIKEATVDAVLKELLGTGYTWTIRGKLITLKKRPATPAASGSQTVPDSSRGRIIKGRVTDSTGTSLGGATIQLKGTARVTTSNEQGSFELEDITNGKGTLVVSFVGYNTSETGIGGRTMMDIMLRPQVSDMKDIVVIGYGTVEKKDLTGSVGKASVEDMNKAPVRSFDEALAGRVAGVNVTSVDGQPGSAVNITIRGANSITQDNSPLYVIDGFPIEGPNNNVINPQDIVSLEVLKDASATAIYGSRGANGVIIITTKRGVAGPPVVSVSTSYGIQKDVNRMQLMDPYEFVKYQLERNPSDAAGIYLANGRQLEDYRTIPEIDWQDELFRTAGMHNTSVSVRGGNTTTKYAISGNILGQQGVMINSGYKRYQGSVSVDQKFSRKLSGGVYVNYAYTNQNGMSPSGPSSSSSTAYTLFSVYGYRNFSLDGSTDLTGELFDQFIDPTIDLRINPVLNQQHMLRENLGQNGIFNAYLTYNILPSLKLKVTGGINTTFTRNNQFNDSFTVYGNPRSLLGSVNGVNGGVYYTQNTTWINENTLTYARNFNRQHALTILAGMTESERRSSSHGSAATNLPNPQLGVSGLDQGTPQFVRALSAAWGLVSFLGRADYKFRDRYLLTLSYRADGSSKFSKEHRWGYFPSGAIAWRFRDEDFLKDSRVLSEGKLRASYGLTGNNRIGEFDYLSVMDLAFNPQGYTFGNQTVTGAIPKSVGNPSLKWETTAQTDLGVDLGFFNNRISLTAEVYRKKTRDLLIYANVPLSLGYGFANRNIGSVQNQGLELTLSTVNIKTKDFKWESAFNISFNQSKILRLTENQESILSAAPFDSYFSAIPAFISRVGGQLGMMYGYIWDGLYQYSDFDVSTTGNYVLKDNVPTNGNTRTAIQPGDIKFKDINGDLVVDAKDYAVIGRGLPVHTGGFNNTLSYKNFDLNLFFQWSYGNDIINANRYIFEGNILGRSNLNQFAGYADRWSPENTGSLNPRGGFGGSGPSTPTGTNSRVIEDGSYLRLKTVRLGYSLPVRVLSRAGIKSLTVYCAAQNLITWTSYSGVDPEVSIFNSVLTPGVDYSAYPRPRTITLGLDLTL
ncbi:TonB-dependent receptor [Niabella beijingensis]|uniref:TonB-dependent receptor n=1 Tax=Niabella beijingensis TaxID=2872700 RepID=UPI001CBAEADF|nr:TonB-dependent receptor [Niabella beijingensis]MBZ4191412.1 TonB-dependent receptor [Niabella beijingensis]